MRAFLTGPLIAILFTACQTDYGRSDHRGLTPPSSHAATTHSAPLQADLEFLARKLEAGIDFFAFGNDPAWTLDMELDGSFTFQTMEGLRVIKPATLMTEAADERVQRYRSVTESGELIVTIVKEACQDTDGRKTLPYRTEVFHKYSGEERGTTYAGCGDYVSDYRLHDIWALLSLGGQEVKASSFDKGLPTIEFHISEHRVMGHDGCNEFNAHLHTHSDVVEIERMHLTARECGPNRPGAAMVAALTEAPLHFKHEGRMLTLLRNDKEVMRLKKVD